MKGGVFIHEHCRPVWTLWFHSWVHGGEGMRKKSQNLLTPISWPVATLQVVDIVGKVGGMHRSPCLCSWCWVSIVGTQQSSCMYVRGVFSSSLSTVWLLATSERTGTTGGVNKVKDNKGSALMGANPLRFRDGFSSFWGWQPWAPWWGEGQTSCDRCHFLHGRGVGRGLVE